MNKREYLAKLKEYLSYELPERLVARNIDYYSEYIDTEVSGGKNVSAVLEDLGDPQLIARSIVDAAKSGRDGIPYTEDDEDFGREIYGKESYGSGSGSGSSSGRTDQAYGTGQGYGTGGSGYGGGSSAGSSAGRDSYGTGERQSGYGERRDSGMRVYRFGCFSGILLLLIVMSVFSLLGSVLGALSPLLAPICVIVLITWLWSQRGRW